MSGIDWSKAPEGATHRGTTAWFKRAEWIRGGDHPGEDDENHPMWTEMQKARAAIARARARGEA